MAKAWLGMTRSHSQAHANQPGPEPDDNMKRGDDRGADPLTFVETITRQQRYTMPPGLTTVDYIPPSLTQSWAEVYGEVLRFMREACSEAREKERAFRWLGFLPQLLLHQPRRMRGTRAWTTILRRRLQHWKDRRIDLLVKD